MTDEIKNKLANLYLQKGSLITQMEDMQNQLTIINEQINQIRSAIIQQAKEKKDTAKVDESHKEHDQSETEKGDTED